MTVDYFEVDLKLSNILFNSKDQRAVQTIIILWSTKRNNPGGCPHFNKSFYTDRKSQEL